jgi:hypothetical protein
LSETLKNDRDHSGETTRIFPDGNQQKLMLNPRLKDWLDVIIPTMVCEYLSRVDGATEQVPFLGSEAVQ